MLGLILSSLLVGADAAPDEWFAAARSGDVAALKRLLDAKVDVDAATAYGATALMFAADKGHAAAVDLLLERKAKVNVKDRFYRSDAITWAAYRGHADVVRKLLAAGASDVDTAFSYALMGKRIDVLSALIESGKVNKATLDSALASVDPADSKIIELLKKAGAKPATAAASSTAKIPPGKLARLAGTYLSKDGMEVKVNVRGESLELAFEGMPAQPLMAENETKFKTGGAFSSTLEFELPADSPATKFSLKAMLSEIVFERAADPNSPEAAAKFVEDLESVASPQPWPSFRGAAAAGIADGQHPPVHWNAERGENLAWKAAIPGLGLSCPVVWENAVYLTTAIGDESKSNLRKGQYGDVEPVEDDSKHRFVVLSVDASTGALRWERTVLECVPAVKRHPKSSHANPTVAVDDKVVIAFFGSEGLYAFDHVGKLLWKKNLGKLDSGWFYDPEYQWGFGASPILHGDNVIVQVDVQKNSFVAAFDKLTGKQVWKTHRDEIPSWSSPTVVRMGSRDVLATNAANFARGYDPATGRELWRIGKNSEIVVPTPFEHAGLVFVASGYTPIRPIYAIKPDASDDISLKAGEKSSAAVAWSESTTGPYMPTPIGYREMLFVCANNGTLACYDAKSGKLHYRKRLPKATSGFTASPVAADGRIYLTTEDGDTLVVKAAKEYELLARNAVNEICLATPAISNGTFFVRGHRHLFALKRSAERRPTEQ